MTLDDLLQTYRNNATSALGTSPPFEQIMAAYLRTDPMYADFFTDVWLWSEFPSRADFGPTHQDVGISIVARTQDGDHWAIQCRCYHASVTVDKPIVDAFLSSSAQSFTDTHDTTKRTHFACRLWIDTTVKGFDHEAEIAITNQTPPVQRIGYADLQRAPVDWQKLAEGLAGGEAKRVRFSVRPHQSLAISRVHEHLQHHDRGKLIMACGTGKTFASLCIAEREAGPNGLVLLLVPSIALVRQSLREWKNQSSIPIHAICICSDTHASKAVDDTPSMSTVDLALPASTDADSIAKQFAWARRRQETEGGNIVVFSTYQSIDVISLVQQAAHQRQPCSMVFDLILCDEAHRTTGVVLSDGDASSFVKVHDNTFILGKKRIYMTATPRIYTEEVRKRAKQSFSEVCSMDDPAVYGEEMYRIGFGEAVEQRLLSDYKVIVLTLAEGQLPDGLAKSIASKDKNITIEDALKYVGCINALSKRFLTAGDISSPQDPTPMRSVVAFCQSIATSESTAKRINHCQDAYFSWMTPTQRTGIVHATADHVSGKMGVRERERKLQPLQHPNRATSECHILCNVRCLSEGVDVPSLDAILFFSPRSSPIDVVQSLGRVMRIAAGKNCGYIIIPVMVPSNTDADKVLSSDRFKGVWMVLNALRAHDDRFDAQINKIDLNRTKPAQISVLGTRIAGDSSTEDGLSTCPSDCAHQREFEKQLELRLRQMRGLIYAKIVQKCGTKPYWERWAADVAKIAERHVASITVLVGQEGNAKTEFDRYLLGLRHSINPMISKQEAIEMLAQHVITQPVFEALFENDSFVKSNPISRALQGIVTVLNQQSSQEDRQKLDRFYASVRRRVEGIDNSDARQRIIVELYEKFFRAAFPKVAEKLGIVYTPVEIVDFILRSVDDILRKEFDARMSDENVHVWDPFTGTGTFITRLLQIGLIDSKDLSRKYAREIHASEMVLLAYYIASINIENIYHELIDDEQAQDGNMHSTGQQRSDTAMQENGYTSFPGICLTDTFLLAETRQDNGLEGAVFAQDAQRIQAERRKGILVIVGNPPYSIGQRSANDNAQNQTYPDLEARIRETYVARSRAHLNKAAYDSYIKAFRWACDRIDPDEGGIVGFVSNASWLDSAQLDGFRKSIESEFSAVYVINLRGALRGRRGEDAKREGGNAFNIMTGVAITILVKHRRGRQTAGRAEIFYKDIGDSLSREQKLQWVQQAGTMLNPGIQMGKLAPNGHGDWIHLRNGRFDDFIPLEPNKKFDGSARSFFRCYSLGIATNKDAWMYNFSSKALRANLQVMVDFFNHQRIAFHGAGASNSMSAKDSVKYDATKITWTDMFLRDLEHDVVYHIDDSRLCPSLYRPFSKSQFCYEKQLLQRTYQQTKLFPTVDAVNLLICVPGTGHRRSFRTLITNHIPDLHNFDGGTQCFPRYWYEETKAHKSDLFVDHGSNYIRHDAVTDFILSQAQMRYGSEVTKEDIFYYVYGILHSPGYRHTFANDLKKMLPRLPLVEHPPDFWAFANAGRSLADLHLNYESRVPPKELLINGKPVAQTTFTTEQLVVKKMAFPSKGQRDTIIYNQHVTISGIPPKAYEYVVNGKSAIEWVMDRYAVTVHKESGIVNDPNTWGLERGNPRYVLDLLLSIVTVSLETVRIVERLPGVQWGA